MTPRNKAIGAVSLAGLIVACGNLYQETRHFGRSTFAPSPTLFTVWPLEVGPAPHVSKLSLKGRFIIRPPDPGEEAKAIPSYSWGGGCLVAQIASRPKQCTSQDECQFNMVGGSPNLAWPGSAYGYCLPPDGLSGDLTGPGTCWVKPSHEHCSKGVPAGSWSTPIVTEDKAREVLRVGESEKLSWRMVACLNGLDRSENDTGNDKYAPPCGELNPGYLERIERAGKIWTPM